MKRSLSPPRWLTRLFPQLTGLEANPVYLRLSGRGYGRPRGIFGAPEEFSLRHSSLLGAIGCLPWFLLLAPPLIPLAVVVALGRVFGGGAAACVHRFVRNGSREPWGEALLLTGYPATEIDKALFAAIFDRAVRWIAGVAGIVAIAVALSAAMAWAVDTEKTFPGGGRLSPTRILLVLLAFLPLAVIDGAALSMIRVSDAIDDAPFAGYSPRRNAIDGTYRIAMMLGLLHIVPVGLGILVFVLFMDSSPLLALAGFYLALATGAAAFAGLAVSIARANLDSGLGKAATTMRGLREAREESLSKAGRA